MGQKQTLSNELLLRRTKWRSSASETRNHFDRGIPRHSEHVWNRTMASAIRYRFAHLCGDSDYPLNIGMSTKILCFSQTRHLFDDHTPITLNQFDVGLPSIDCFVSD